MLREGRDVIGQAQTGTGKTAAFGLPLLDYLDVSDHEVQALVLTPTRELCIQVTQALRAYGAALGAEIVAVFGGAPIRNQVAQLKQGGQVVVGTVGRVMDLMGRHELMLSSARYVVLDEADEMLDLGFLEDVEWILQRCPSGRQTALFSATMPPPIRTLAESRMLDPVTIRVRATQLTIDTVNQFFVPAPERGKADVLARVLREERPEQAIIFARTKIGVDRLARSLTDSGLRVKALHGDMTQGTRDGVMIAFKDGRERLLVATDIAARGLDISGVTHVVNYDIPNSPDVYVHRIGRTGRVGRSGTAITLVTERQRRDLEAIERHANTSIRPWGDPDGASRGAPAARPDGEPPRRRLRAAANGHAPGPAAPEPAIATAEAAPPEPDGAEARRPRHTKPREAELDAPRAKVVVAAGRAHGVEPADLIGVFVDHSHLEGEDIHRVRTLERYSFVEVPLERADDVVDSVRGHRVRGMELRLEVLTR